MNSNHDISRCFFRFANITFSVIGNHECNLLSTLPGFSPFLFDPVNCDLSRIYSVHFLGSDLFSNSLNDSHLLYRFSFEDDAIDCRFYRSLDTYYFTMIPADSDVPPLLLIYHSGENVIKASYAANPTILRFSLWMAFALVSVPNGAIPIHASTIVCHNRAVLFLGESGTGKSTHTRLWLNNISGAHLLNDDSPILYLDNHFPMVSGSPWSGKTHCYHNRQFPLDAVVRLSQAPANNIRKLPIVESFTALQPSCPPALAYDDQYTDWVVDIISKVVATVPVFHLECLPDADAARLSYSTIFAS